MLLTLLIPALVLWSEPVLPRQLPQDSTTLGPSAKAVESEILPLLDISSRALPDRIAIFHRIFGSDAHIAPNLRPRILGLYRRHPERREQIVNSLIALLDKENSVSRTTTDSASRYKEYLEYYSGLILIVAELRDPKAISVLTDAIINGNQSAARSAALGEMMVPPALKVFKSSNLRTRYVAGQTLESLLSRRREYRLAPKTVLEIEAALRTALDDPDDVVRKSASRALSLLDIPNASDSLNNMDGAGTYDVTICKDMCSRDDTTMVLARGKLVIISPRSLNDLDSLLSMYHDSSFDYREKYINACYVFEKYPAQPLRLGPAAFGSVSIRYSPMIVGITLSKDPRGSYTGPAIFHQGGFVGTITGRDAPDSSVLFGMKPGETRITATRVTGPPISRHPIDYIFGKRVGPPNLRHCAGSSAKMSAKLSDSDVEVIQNSVVKAIVTEASALKSADRARSTVCISVQEKGKIAAPGNGLLAWLRDQGWKAVPMGECPKTYASMIMIVDSLGRHLNAAPPGYVDPFRISITKIDLVSNKSVIVTAALGHGTATSHYSCDLGRGAGGWSAKCTNYRFSVS